MKDTFQILITEFKKIHEKINREANSHELVYHYTDYDGLKGILQQQKLRYTNYKYFNDPTEIKYAINLIKESLLHSEILRYYYPLFMGFFDIFDANYNLYIACFSKEIKKLSLWRYYANNGSGFAIGFNKSFHEVANRKEGFSNIKSIKVEVKYGKENAKQIINQFIKIIENHPEIFKQHVKIILNQLIRNLSRTLPMLKDDSFEEENEIRVFCSEPPSEIDDKYRDFIPISVKEKLPFVNQQHGRKPVITLEFLPSAISEIWIGPCCEFLEAKKHINKLLYENGFNTDEIQIKKASLPYQNS